MENRIGDARREYADRVGKFTQEDAADFFGVSLSTYKKWEQGQGMMNGEQLRAISEKYGVTVDYLLYIDNAAVQDMDNRIGIDLSPDERKLVALYRNMEPRLQALTMENARSFAALSEKDGAGDTRDVARVGEILA